MAVVVVRAALWPAGPHGEDGLATFQSLDLALLVDAEDQCVFRRAHVESHDVADLLDEKGIGRQPEGLGAGLESEGLPDPSDAVVGDPGGFSHGAGAPVGRVFRGLLKGVGDDLFNLGVGDGAGCPGTWGVAKPLHTVFMEAVAPLSDRGLGDAQFLGGLLSIAALGKFENDPCAQGDSLRGVPPSAQRKKMLPLLVGKNNVFGGPPGR